MFKTKTKTSWSKTKTFIFLLEAPRDQDPGLEDYITGYLLLQWNLNTCLRWSLKELGEMRALVLEVYLLQRILFYRLFQM